MAKNTDISPTVTIWNRRMIELLDYVVFKGIEEHQTAALIAIGFTATHNINQVRTGKQGFTHANFHTASKKYNVDMDWFYGFTPHMLRTGKEPTAVQLAAKLVEMLEKSHN